MNSLQAKDTVVIIGAGQAGCEAAIELRRLGFAGQVTVVGDEPHLPYRRPPLSKTYFSGAADRNSLTLVSQVSLDKANIKFLSSARAICIDRVARDVEFSGGGRLPYTKLLLATGSRPRPLTLPGADRPNVFPLRTISDVDAIRRNRSETCRIVVVGGGYIGLEVAASATAMGHKVTVLESLDRVLARATVPEVSAFYERVHRERGVDVRTRSTILDLEGDPRVTHVRLSDGTRLEADLVVFGIGVLPNVELAAEAGLAVENGIVVDEFTQTADPHVHAAGDCTNHPNEFLGRRVRLESVPNAIEQARTAAHVMMGQAKPYRAVPWFWSDQFDLKLQMVGIAEGFDHLVVRGDIAAGHNFSAFCLRDGKVVAATTVNRTQEFLIAKKLVAAGSLVDPAQLVDETISLATLIPT
ncbi:NAD(P)/FAD-dependent oxidoreductase [Methylibium sp.]|uniref:NAD(P)/FAD-dependent oxidoreductase n=1 Tax=Methylibium sp. TaxID=2067992 RepID=UPI003D1187AB